MAETDRRPRQKGASSDERPDLLRSPGDLVKKTLGFLTKLFASGATECRKLQSQGVHHITLVGADRQTSIDFWEGVLGMPFVFEQPNLDVPEESHLYFDPGDGRLITVFTNENRKPDRQPTPTEIGYVHHIAFWVSRATFAQAVDAARRARHPAQRRQGSRLHGLDLFPRSARLPAASSPPIASSRRRAARMARCCSRRTGSAWRAATTNIAEVHLADAIEDLTRGRRGSLSDDRSPKNPY